MAWQGSLGRPRLKFNLVDFLNTDFPNEWLIKFQTTFNMRMAMVSLGSKIACYIFTLIC